MDNYTRLTIDQIQNTDALVNYLSEGKVIIEILVDDRRNWIMCLKSYGIDANCESKYVSLVENKEELKDETIIYNEMGPYGGFCLPHWLDSDYGIFDDCQDILAIYHIPFHFKNYKESLGKKHHYEVFVSNKKGDFKNFGGEMELSFMEEWMIEKGVYTP